MTRQEKIEKIEQLKAEIIVFESSQEEQKKKLISDLDKQTQEQVDVLSAEIENLKNQID